MTPNGGVTTTSAPRVTSPGSTEGFNPQPDPPKATTALTTPGATRAFNPQPEPPKGATALTTPGATRAFNPQPEPPARGGASRKVLKAGSHGGAVSTQAVQKVAPSTRTR